MNISYLFYMGIKKSGMVIYIVVYSRYDFCITIKKQLAFVLTCKPEFQFLIDLAISCLIVTKWLVNDLSWTSER